MKLFRKTYDKYSDEQLMHFLADGSEAAFDELYHRYAKKMHSYFYKLLYQDKELAADFCQNLFLKIFEKASTYNSSFKFSTWLYTIASNMVKNEYRRQQRPTPTLFIQKAQTSQVEPQGPKNLDQEIFDKQLQVAMNKLDEKHRLCFILRYQEEKSIKEISAILACPAGTIKSRIHYTLKKIAEDMKLLHPNNSNTRNERINH